MQLKSKIFHLISTLSRKIQIALITTLYMLCMQPQEAVNHAGLDVEAIDKDRFGVIVASGIGGIKEIEDQVIRLHEKGPKRVKPMTLPKALPNMASGNVAMRLELMEFEINQHSLASSNDAIGMLSALISLVSKILMLVGGSEASITPFAIAGFPSLTALSTIERSQLVLLFHLIKIGMDL